MLIRVAMSALLVAGLLVSSANSAQAQPGPDRSVPHAKKVTATVLKVLDGQRVRVKQGRRTLTVTLAGIDAPRGADCYASESTAGLRTLLPARSRVKVTILKKRGRTATGYVLRSGVDASAAMVTKGLAESNGTNSQFDALESQAASAGVGLFGACSGTTSTQETPPSRPSGGSTPQASPQPSSGGASAAKEYTAAEKQEIIQRYQRNLPGLQVSFSTGNGSVTDTYGISFCSGSVYSLMQITSFSGSGSTSSQHAGSWRIVEAGGVPRESEIVRISYTPGEPGRDPFFTDLGQLAGGVTVVNGRQAEVSQQSQCWDTGSKVVTTRRQS